MDDVSIYIYCYDDKVYVTRKPINTNKHIRRQNSLSQKVYGKYAEIFGTPLNCNDMERVHLQF